ncbi:phage tail protein [Rhizobium sp. P38BS-XIX]|uniref:phage tail protein n=1 Tax=Rhizobium sp. P38BS-XIX TaxID=2726740 RepID=UPI001456A94C|nr:phage tail protein [Rhizobium sp. P38BS-XIX]NLS00181.1 phage tail protein [Rhizobium sp. P38BS-XIX]
MDFNEIPLDWLEPATLIEIKPNYQNVGVLPYPQKVVIVGHKLAAGTLAPGQIVQITRGEEGIAYFGQGSIGAEMVASFRKANKTTPLYVTALADAVGAVKAAGKLTFTGTVPVAMVLRFKIGGRPIRITVRSTDTAASMATALAAAINADTANVVTAAAAAGVVTCTARSGGEVGNDINLRVDVKAQALPPSLTIAIDAMTGGAGNPLVQAALDTIANTWFTMALMPWSDVTNMAALAQWLGDRYTATAKLDVHGFVAKAGTFGQLTTFGNLTNLPFLSAMGLSNSPTSSWNLAAAVCGLAAFHLTNDPARQLRSLVVPGVEAPDEIDQFEETEQNLLLGSGISTFDHLPDGTTTISRIVTTYKMSSLGIPDRAWLDIMVPATMSRIRYDWAGYVTLMYPRSKLAEDDSASAFAVSYDNDGAVNTAVVTPGRMKASWAARCKLYSDNVWIEDTQTTVKQSVFAIAANDRNRLEARQQVKIVGNLMVFAASLEFQV